jgi:hypothetical protein
MTGYSKIQDKDLLGKVVTFSSYRIEPIQLTVKMSTISIESIQAFLEKLKIPKSLDEFLDSSKNDQVVVGGLAGLIKYTTVFLQI